MLHLKAGRFCQRTHANHVATTDTPGPPVQSTFSVHVFVCVEVFLDLCFSIAS